MTCIVQLKVRILKNKKKILLFLSLLYSTSLFVLQNKLCTLLKSDATIIRYYLLSLRKLHVCYSFATIIAVCTPSPYGYNVLQIATHSVLWYQPEKGRLQAMFLHSMNLLTTVRYPLMQRYVLCAVLNNVARLLVRASTQSLCRFIHGVSYSTRMVISTLLLLSTLCNFAFQGNFCQSPTIYLHFQGSFSYPLTFSFFVCFCICVCICVHVYTQCTTSGATG